MKVLRTRAELTEELDPLWKCAARISLIPTMGALHEGHLSLARLCGPCDVRVMSIFVNPTQFGANEDLARYPRTLDQDLVLCEQEGIDFVYAPTSEEMYASKLNITVDPGELGEIWEGAIRPGHFRGVLTVVAKLLHQVRPDAAVFGEKDFQQLALIRGMCKALDWPVSILAARTLREDDGLAMSSRNRFLKQQEREQAVVLYQALCAGKEAVKSGKTRLAEIKEIMLEVAGDVPAATVDYLTAVDSESMAEQDEISRNARLIGAIRLGSVRLIDNMAAHDASPELSTV